MLLSCEGCQLLFNVIHFVRKCIEKYHIAVFHILYYKDRAAILEHHKEHVVLFDKGSEMVDSYLMLHIYVQGENFA